jgi:ribosome-associated toxin RatA of RatAB toxin-antitoxin module
MLRAFGLPLLLALVLAPVPLAGAGAPDVDVTVRSAEGVYTVAAKFRVARSPEQVLAVLTDYERIPKIVPDVTRSTITSRTGQELVVEQDAVSRAMFFSRTVHLRLAIRESDDRIVFRDTSGKSFEVYEGVWQLVPAEGTTLVTYELRARPTFDVPRFVVTRLLKRDVARLVTRLRDVILG